MRKCQVPGCGEMTTRFGRYCTSHKARARRHGDVYQRGVTATELKPFVMKVRARMAKNADNPLWDQCDARWRAIVDHAVGISRTFQSGQPGNRYEHQAAKMVMNVGSQVEPRAVVETALAMYLMREADPHRFTSDAAFSVQLARRLRGLGEVNATTTVDRSGRQRRVYRELSPKVTTVIAQWAAQALGAAGIIIARLEMKEVEAARAERDAFSEALSRLT